MNRSYFISIIPLALGLLLYGCGDDDTMSQNDPDDMGGPVQTSFVVAIKPILASCTSCHTNGTGGWTYNGGPQAYAQTIDKVDKANAAASSLLLKAINESAHGGGPIFGKDSEEYRSILAWIEEGALDN